MIVLQLVTVYQHVACLAAIPASYAGHRLMVETIQVGSFIPTLISDPVHREEAGEETYLPPTSDPTSPSSPSQSLTRLSQGVLS